MPIIPSVGAAPFDSVNDVLNAARIRLNDEVKTLLPVSGSLIDSTQAFTQQGFNNAWRRFNSFLANLGYSKLIGRAILPSVPPVGSQDPAVQASIDWTGYFDGVNFFDSPSFPPDMIFPLRLKERITGMNAGFADMEPWAGMLPSTVKIPYNRVWQWRADAIYLPGALNVLDLELYYGKYLGDFVDANPLRWFQQPVPIVYALDSLAWYVCSEFASARDDMDATRFDARAEKAAREIMNRDVRLNQTRNIRRLPRSQRGGQTADYNGYGWGPW